MNKQDVRQLATEVLVGIAPEADLATVGAGADLRQALDLDSMDFLNFVIGLAAGSNLPIPEADYPQLYTLLDIESYLSAKK